MKSIPSQLWIFLSSLFVAWFSYRGVHHYASLRDRQAEIVIAGNEFIDSFLNELSILKNHSPEEEEVNVKLLLSESFDKHRKALVKFKASLPKSAADRLEIDWKVYYHSGNDFSPEWPDHEKMNFFGDYLAINPTEQSDAINLALQRIEALLSHAKQT